MYSSKYRKHWKITTHTHTNFCHLLSFKTVNGALNLKSSYDTLSFTVIILFKSNDLPCLSQNEANKIKKEAADLDRLIDQKLKDYEDLREDMRGKEHEVKNLLEKGKAEQQVSLTCCWL